MGKEKPLPTPKAQPAPPIINMSETTFVVSRAGDTAMRRLTNRIIKNLGFTGPFEKLTPVQQAKVTTSIGELY